MFKILQPHIEELLGRKIQEPTDEEKDRVKKAKEIVAELLKMKKLDFEGKSPIDIYTQGQKPKQTENEKVISKPQILKDLRKNSPATPPPDAIGRRKESKNLWIGTFEV